MTMELRQPLQGELIEPGQERQGRILQVGRESQGGIYSLLDDVRGVDPGGHPPVQPGRDQPAEPIALPRRWRPPRRVALAGTLDQASVSFGVEAMGGDSPV